MVELKKTSVSTPDSSALSPLTPNPYPILNWSNTVDIVTPRPGMSPFLARCLSLAHFHGAVAVAMSRPKPERLSGTGAGLSGTLCLEGKRFTA